MQNISVVNRKFLADQLKVRYYERKSLIALNPFTSYEYELNLLNKLTSHVTVEDGEVNTWIHSMGYREKRCSNLKNYKMGERIKLLKVNSTKYSHALSDQKTIIITNKGRNIYFSSDARSNEFLTLFKDVKKFPILRKLKLAFTPL